MLHLLLCLIRCAFFSADSLRAFEPHSRSVSAFIGALQREFDRDERANTRKRASERHGHVDIEMEIESDDASSLLLSPSQRALLKEMHSLNHDQRAAIQKSLMAQDYALILGMPGTGKSSTVVFFIRLLVALDRTVLLSGYTHSGNFALSGLLGNCMWSHVFLNLQRLIIFW